MHGAFCVLVSFALAPGRREEFLALIRANAADSVHLEPGCLRFDIVVPEAPDEVHLYEIYADRAAFDVHLASAHFRRFDAASSALVAGKKIAVGALIENVK